MGESFSQSDPVAERHVRSRVQHPFSVTNLLWFHCTHRGAHIGVHIGMSVVQQQTAWGAECGETEVQVTGLNTLIQR